MSLITRIITDLWARRQRLLDGLINCIPSPLPGFRRDFPGIEQSKYYLVSGGAKAKS